MFSLLVERELKGILLSPKFTATFGVCSLLMLLSLFVGIQEYRHSVDQYNTAIQLNDRELAGETSWWGVESRVYRRPDPMQVFVSGVDYDVGRLSEISTWNEVKLQNSAYSDDSLFAIFRFVDFTFIVQIVLSLFAILFTYDSINGERETGTLKLSLANAVPRPRYVLAKFVGAWVGLTIPVLIPILLAVLVVLLVGLPMSADNWAKLAAFLGVSVLYFTFFIALGIFVSAITRRSSVSFLILLVIWVALVLIIPRAATMAAGQIVRVASVAEIDARKDRYSTDRWLSYRSSRMQQRDEREAQMANMTEEERGAFRAANSRRWAEEDDALRQSTTEDIAEYNRRLDEDLNNQKAEMQAIAFSLSRISPASAFQIAAMNLAGTNIDVKTRYEQAMQTYRNAFSTFVNAKRQEERAKDRRRFSTGQDEPLDLTEMPRFQPPDYTFKEALAPSVVDMGLLSLYSLLAFAGAFVAFLKYDVR
ncbi:MAG TPA: ABC transporter permease subunit [Rhodothermales bacterium]|nr:ABC transporter permease subunit [Rhodothermales bacterium]